jgi:methyl-accepting chemotaxis protein
MLNKLLVNLPVRSKLLLGFTLVIALTVLIALTGWRGIDSLSERSEPATCASRDCSTH